MLIVIEGIDGAGKTSVCNELFSSYPHDAQFLRTPGGAFKEVRELVLNPDYNMDKMAKLFFFLGEMIHITNQLDLSNDKKDYIFDRFFPSTYIYQVAMRRDEISFIERNLLNSLFMGFMPNIDLTVILTVDSGVGMARSAKDLEFGKRDAFEAEGIQAWKKRRYFYENFTSLPISKKLGEVLFIDTTNISVDETSRLILEKVKEIKGCSKM